MPRKRFFPTDQFPYHVTARRVNKEWFPLPLDEVWDIFCFYLYTITLSYKVRIHAFVLMNNHFHLLLSTPEANLDKAMNYLMREVSKAISRKSGRINQVFGGLYHWSLVKDRTQYEIVHKYVYRNPIEAGICSRVEIYPYSTLPMILGQKKMRFPVVDNTCLIQNPTRELAWLNAPFENKLALHEIRLALRKQEFILDQTLR